MMQYLGRAAIALALSAATLMGQQACAAYPDKPVRLVVPFPPGGSADTVARLLGHKLSASLGQQFVIDNRPGAGGSIGSELVAKAPADGYTILLGAISSHAITPSLYAKLGYDARKDFAPISLVTTMPNVLVVHPSVKANSVKELVALAKSKPGQLTFASGGNGTTHHLCGELFDRMAGISMLHVPYKGNAPAMTDLLGGQVLVMFDNISNSLPQIRARKLRALAVTGAKRSPALPDVPTLAESGFPGYDVTSWFGLFAPASTPTNVIEKLNAEVIKALRDTSIRERLAQDGIEAGGDTPAHFKAFVDAELVRWATIVKDSGARVD